VTPDPQQEVLTPHKGTPEMQDSVFPVDRNGAPLRTGQTVLVTLNDEDVESAEVVKLTSSRTVGKTGHWVEVDKGRGAERTPSYLLEVADSTMKEVLQIIKTKGGVDDLIRQGEKMIADTEYMDKLPPGKRKAATDSLREMKVIRAEMEEEEKS
jgi:hypothetical protein